ncbi:MAG: hypothetical protein IJ083_05355 [Clostridia bacterium]|nr:hypothetical protein [Clostridia bacterium]
MDELLARKDTVMLEPDSCAEIFGMLDRFMEFCTQRGVRYSNLCQQHRDETEKRLAEEAKRTADMRARHRSVREEASRRYEQASADIRQAQQRVEKSCAQSLEKEERDLEEKLKGYRQVNHSHKETIHELVWRAEEAEKSVHRIFTDAMHVMAASRNRTPSDMEQQLAGDLRARSANMPGFQGDGLGDVERFLQQDLEEDCKRQLAEVRRRAPRFFGGMVATGRLMQAMATIYHHMDTCNQVIQAAREEEARQGDREDRVLQENTRVAKQACDTACRKVRQKAENLTEENRRRQETLDAEYRKVTKAVQAREDAEVAQMKRNMDESAREEAGRQNQQKIAMQRSIAGEYEAAFPVDAMKELRRQIWDQRMDVEGNPRAQGRNRKNILMGVAAVSFIRLYEGEGGQLCRYILTTRYPFLFPQESSGKKGIRGTHTFWPYTFSTQICPSMLIDYADAHEGAVRSWMNAIGIRLLWSVSAPRQKIRMIDRVSMGAFNALLSLNPSDPTRAGQADIGSFVPSGHASISQEDIRQEIRDLLSYYNGSLNSAIEQYGSLWQYNEQNPDRQENFQALLMMNFPEGLSESSDMLRDVGMLTGSCRNLGLTSIFARPAHLRSGDARKQMEVEQAVRGMQHFRTVENGGRVYLQAVTGASKTLQEALISVFPVPDGQALGRIAHELEEAYRGAANVTYDFDRSLGIYPRQDEILRGNAAERIRIPVGYYTGARPCELELSDTRVHTIISGETGSGKSNLLHVIVLNTMLRYSPDEVQLVLIDFKHGTDFSAYANYNLPGFMVMSITDEPAYPRSVLDMLNQEIDRRAEMFNRAEASSYLSFRKKKPGARLPRIVIIIDELYMLSSEAEKAVGEDIVGRIEDFARRGRSYGMHLILASQQMWTVKGIENIQSNCASRIAMHCSEEETRRLMENSEEAGVMSRDVRPENHGRCIVSTSSGKNPAIMDVVNLKETAAFSQSLETLSRYYISKGRYTTAKVLLMKPELYFNHVYHRFVNRGELPEMEECNTLWLGDALRLSMNLRLRADAHLWIGGGQTELSEKAGLSMMYYSLVSLLIQNRALKAAGKQQRTIMALNGLRRRGESVRNTDAFGQLCDNCRSIVQYYCADELDQALQKIEEYLDARMRNPGNTDGEMYVLMQRLESCDGADRQIQYRFQQIFTEGAKLGIHIIVWTEDMDRAIQVLQMQEITSVKRICLKMGDMARFIGKSDYESQIDGFRALVVGENLLMRVYDLPVSGEWKEKIINAINAP